MNHKRARDLMDKILSSTVLENKQKYDRERRCSSRESAKNQPKVLKIKKIKYNKLHFY